MKDKKELVLAAPSEEDALAIEQYKKEFEEAHQLLQGMEQERGLDEALSTIPNRTFLYKDETGRIVGMSNLRLGLNAFLYEHAGHVGYSIRPSEQGKGYGTELLRATLWMAFMAGFDQVLVVCHRDNQASRRMIENCGGVPEEENGEWCRYWVATQE
ncbi:MAG: GNAT family N-acetyltransferase [Eubacterium sp.]|nr:GNAT family N-acetyltransferase [Eubacterium sp.]